MPSAGYYLIMNQIIAARLGLDEIVRGGVMDDSCMCSGFYIAHLTVQ